MARLDCSLHSRNWRSWRPLFRYPVYSAVQFSDGLLFFGCLCHYFICVILIWEIWIDINTFYCFWVWSTDWFLANILFHWLSSCLTPYTAIICNDLCVKQHKQHRYFTWNEIIISSWTRKTYHQIKASSRIPTRLTKTTEHVLYLTCMKLGRNWIFCFYRRVKLAFDFNPLFFYPFIYAHLAIYFIWQRDTTAKGSEKNKPPNLIPLQYQVEFILFD